MSNPGRKSRSLLALLVASVIGVTASDVQVAHAASYFRNNVASTSASNAILSAKTATSPPNPVPGTTKAPSPGSLRSAVSPLADPRGLHPGLTPVPKAELVAALRLIDTVRTASVGTKKGYNRALFGGAWTDNAQNVPWAGNRCDTRDDILRRDLVQVRFRAGTHDCVVAAGSLSNPYLGNTIVFRKAHAGLIQIDHVIPLSLAWQMGAAGWTKPKRVQIANDPLNLLAVDQRSNTTKSDDGPAEWLPGNGRIRCAYSVRVAQVALKYDLPVTSADKATMRRQCSRNR